MPNPFRGAQVEYIQAGRFGNCRVGAIQDVLTDVAVAQRSVESMPIRHRQPRVRNRVGRAIDVHARSSQKEGVHDLCESAVEGKVASHLDGCLGFPSVGPTRPFKLECAMVGNIDLLVRPVD